MSNQSTMVNSDANTLQNAPALVKKIDKTTFVVRIHFSATSNENMEDKVKRMLKSEMRK